MIDRTEQKKESRTTKQKKPPIMAVFYTMIDIRSHNENGTFRTLSFAGIAVADKSASKNKKQILKRFHVKHYVYKTNLKTL